MRPASACVVLAIVGPFFAGCGGDTPGEPAATHGTRYTITNLDHNNPAEVRRFTVWECSRSPMTSLIQEAGGRTAPTAIARAKARQFPPSIRKAAYAGCLQGVRTYRGAW
jgi:hypothetical protein